MICPRCGSRDVDFTAVPEKKLHYCECNNCHHEWEESYNPYPHEAGSE